MTCVTENDGSVVCKIEAQFSDGRPAVKYCPFPYDLHKDKAVLARLGYSFKNRQEPSEILGDIIKRVEELELNPEHAFDTITLSFSTARDCKSILTSLFSKAKPSTTDPSWFNIQIGNQDGLFSLTDYMMDKLAVTKAVKFNIEAVMQSTQGSLTEDNVNHVQLEELAMQTYDGKEGFYWEKKDGTELSGLQDCLRFLKRMQDLVNAKVCLVSASDILQKILFFKLEMADRNLKLVSKFNDIVCGYQARNRKLLDCDNLVEAIQAESEAQAPSDLICVKYESPLVGASRTRSEDETRWRFQSWNIDDPILILDQPTEMRALSQSPSRLDEAFLRFMNQQELEEAWPMPLQESETPSTSLDLLQKPVSTLKPAPKQYDVILSKHQILDNCQYSKTKASGPWIGEIVVPKGFKGLDDNSRVRIDIDQIVCNIVYPCQDVYAKKYVLFHAIFFTEEQCLHSLRGSLKLGTCSPVEHTDVQTPASMCEKEHILAPVAYKIASKDKSESILCQIQDYPSSRRCILEKHCVGIEALPDSGLAAISPSLKTELNESLEVTVKPKANMLIQRSVPLIRASCSPSWPQVRSGIVSKAVRIVLVENAKVSQDHPSGPWQIELINANGKDVEIFQNEEEKIVAEISQSFLPAKSFKTCQKSGSAISYVTFKPMVKIDESRDFTVIKAGTVLSKISGIRPTCKTVDFENQAEPPPPEGTESSAKTSNPVANPKESRTYDVKFHWKQLTNDCKMMSDLEDPVTFIGEIALNASEGKLAAGTRVKLCFDSDVFDLVDPIQEVHDGKYVLFMGSLRNQRCIHDQADTLILGQCSILEENHHDRPKACSQHLQSFKCLKPAVLKKEEKSTIRCYAVANEKQSHCLKGRHELKVARGTLNRGLTIADGSWLVSK